MENLTNVEEELEEPKISVINLGIFNDKDQLKDTLKMIYWLVEGSKKVDSKNLKCKYQILPAVNPCKCTIDSKKYTAQLEGTRVIVTSDSSEQKNSKINSSQNNERAHCSKDSEKFVQPNLIPEVKTQVPEQNNEDYPLLWLNHPFIKYIIKGISLSHLFHPGESILITEHFQGFSLKELYELYPSVDSIPCDLSELICSILYRINRFDKIADHFDVFEIKPPKIEQ